MRKTPTTVLASLAAAGVLALGLSACGDDGGPEASSAGQPMTTMTAHDHPPTTASPAADLRVTLNRLLGEHALLAVVAMQKGYDGAPDFEASAAALEQNTVELGAAFGSVYGAEAQEGFLELWRQHIGFFVDYTVASAEDDQAGKDLAVQKLDGYRQAFAAFLTGANPNLEADGVADMLAMHVTQLTGALDSYAAGDYAEANADLRESYGHMFMTGDALAAAIVAQSPDEFAAEE